MKKGGRRHFYAVLAVASLAALIAGLARSPQRLLLKQSVKVASTDEFNEYAWVSSHEILFFNNTQDPRTYRYIWSVQRLDVDTGRRILCPALARVLNQARGCPDHLKTSPDGKWLLWADTDHQHSPIGCLASTDGMTCTHFRVDSMTTIDTTEPDQMVWMSDSRHFVEFDRGRVFWPPAPVSYAITRDVVVPGFSVQQALPGGAQAVDYLNALVVSGQQVIIVSLDSSGDLFIAQARLTSGASLVNRRTDLHLDQVQCSDEALSRQGRLAVSGLLTVTSPIAMWLHHWLPIFKQRSNSVVALSVCNWNGGGLHEVGYVPSEVDKDNPPNLLIPDDIQWSPDSKHIGFVYMGALYTIAVD